MLWDTFSSLDFQYKVLAVAATLIAITSGTLTIVWHIKTWHRRRLKLLEEYLESREEDASRRRPQLLKKIANSLYKPPPADEPDISKHVEEAIELLDHYKVSAAQMRLEELQEWIKEKKSFVAKYAEDLTRHEANVHLFLAAIADRRNNPRSGLDHISEARRLLGNSGDDIRLDLLKYEGFLQLKARKWTEAQSAFERLEDAARGGETRHYKAVGACGRGDALHELADIEGAIAAYDRALSRMNDAPVAEREPVFNGVVHLKLAGLRKAKGDPESLRLARDNATEALKAFRSTNGLGVRSEDMRAVVDLKAELDTVLAEANSKELLK
jgi:tetratricopeptide (TPR) repeat protein